MAACVGSQVGRGERNRKCFFFFFFKQKTAYEISTGDWSSDVCSSDLPPRQSREVHPSARRVARPGLTGSLPDSAAYSPPDSSVSAVILFSSLAASSAPGNGFFCSVMLFQVAADDAWDFRWSGHAAVSSSPAFFAPLTSALMSL